MAKKNGKGYRLTWKGDEVIKDAEQVMGEALGQVGLAVEAEAKKQLRKGHGVVTGTLRRSIHTAPPSYNWGSDNIKASDGTPERGGKAAEPEKKNGRMTIQVGSGMIYALFIELGGDVENAMMGTGNPFVGYRYLRNALEKVKPKVPRIFKAFFERKFGGRSRR